MSLPAKRSSLPASAPRSPVPRGSGAIKKILRMFCNFCLILC